MAKKQPVANVKNAVSDASDSGAPGSVVPAVKAPAAEKMQIVYLPVRKLIHPAYNPRKITDADFAQLKTSLTTFDAVDPAVVNMYPGREYTLIGGNQRVRASKALGWTEFPCVIVKLDEKAERELNIRLNKNAGEWDFKILLDEFKVPDLVDFGFDIVDLKGYDPKVDNEIMTSSDSDVTVASDEKAASDIQSLVYCALQNRVDVGRGYCTHGCLYCYTKMTPAGLAMKPGKYTVSTKKSLLDVVAKAEKEGSIVTIGICNDPTMPVFAERLEFMLRTCAERKVNILVQTKNPGAVLKIIKDKGIDTSKITIKTSFSLCKDAREIEPGAPSVDERVAALLECGAAGIDVITRFQPFLLGYYDGMPELLNALKKVSNRVVCEPLRVNAGGKRYMETISPFLTKDNKSLDDYLKRICRRDVPLYGAMHWYDYDKDMLHDAYKHIKKLANASGYKFGICSGVLGIEHCDLNEGDFCCQTKRMKDTGVAVDKYSLAAMHASGDVEKYVYPELQKDPRFVDSTEYILMMDRISWANDPMYRMPACSHKHQ